MSRKTKKYRSSSAEKRHRQDSQALMIYFILSIVSLVAWLWEGGRDYFLGAFQAIIMPLLVIMLRYIFRVTRGYRNDPMGILTAFIFVVLFCLVVFYAWPHTLWQYFIVLLSLMATVYGIQQFRFSPIFILLNCLMAGAILLP